MGRETEPGRSKRSFHYRHLRRRAARSGERAPDLPCAAFLPQTYGRMIVVLRQRFQSKCKRPHPQCDRGVKFHPPRVKFCEAPHSDSARPHPERDASHFGFERPHTRRGARRNSCKARGFRCGTRVKPLGASCTERERPPELCGRLHPENRVSPSRNLPPRKCSRGPLLLSTAPGKLPHGFHSQGFECLSIRVHARPIAVE